MSTDQVRTALLRRLHAVAQRLPNGLLHRLVLDAEFFHDWNMGKKKARASARLAQYKKSTESPHAVKRRPNQRTGNAGDDSSICSGEDS